MPAATPIQSRRTSSTLPLDSIPGEGSDRAFAANRQAEMEILRAAGIQSVQGDARTAIEELQTARVIETRCTQGERRCPQEEIHDVAHASTKHGESFEEQRHGGCQKHGWQGKK